MRKFRIGLLAVLLMAVLVALVMSSAPRGWRLASLSVDTAQAWLRSRGVLKRRVPVHVFPFRMMAENMEAHAASRCIGFSHELRRGHDLFEATRVPPRVCVRAGREETPTSLPVFRRSFPDRRSG